MQHFKFKIAFIYLNTNFKIPLWTK